jgi:hypothetical protein
MIEIYQPADAICELFPCSLEEVFFPALAASRGLPGCQGKSCVFLCDNRSIHSSEPILARFAENGIAIITDPPHMSHTL